MLSMWYGDGQMFHVEHVVYTTRYKWIYFNGQLDINDYNDYLDIV